jgi:hypothetical protein
MQNLLLHRPLGRHAVPPDRVGEKPPDQRERRVGPGPRPEARDGDRGPRPEGRGPKSRERRPETERPDSERSEIDEKPVSAVGASA